MINKENKENLIIISGPTASGKSALSIDLAKEINGSVISADSMQVYKGMDIGSAKITADEMQGIKHYLIDIIDPKDEFNITLFKEYARNSMLDIYKENKIPIIVGGTGFYIQSLLYDIDFDEIASENASIREELTKIANEKGNEYLHSMLQEVDPVSANDIHPNNLKRVIRAIEFYRLTGQKISDHNEEQHKKESPYNYKYFVININRDLLYQNIDKRVDMMIEKGLVDEVLKLKNAGFNRNFVSMQGLGYKEILDYLDNKISLEEATQIIKRDTRHFAKRQITWFKREKNVTWINKEEFDFDDNKIINFMKEQLSIEGII